MIRRNFAWRSVAVLGAACLALGACSNDGEEPTTGGSSAPAATGGDGVLKVGTLLPQTGSLAFLGPPEFAGVDLAVKEINAAGGVLGKDVVVSDTDSGDTSTDIGRALVDALVGGGGNAASIVASRGLAAVRDDASLLPAIDQVLDENPSEADRFRAGDVRLLGFFTGQVMRRVGKGADAARVQELLRSRLAGG